MGFEDEFGVGSGECVWVGLQELFEEGGDVLGCGHRVFPWGGSRNGSWGNGSSSSALSAHRQSSMAWSSQRAALRRKVSIFPTSRVVGTVRVWCLVGVGAVSAWVACVVEGGRGESGF